MNSITICTAQFDGQVYNGKWDVSKTVSNGEVSEMANWIKAEFTAFWVETETANPQVKTAQ